MCRCILYLNIQLLKEIISDSDTITHTLPIFSQDFANFLPDPAFHDSGDIEDIDPCFEGLPDGSAFVQARLRKKVYVKTFATKYPTTQAGTSIPKPTGITPTQYTTYGKRKDPKKSNIYAPFNSQTDWEMARWAKLNSSSTTAITELLGISGLHEKLGLSYKNSKDLNKIIDTQMPTVRPKFKKLELELGGHIHVLYYRDIIACVRALYGAPEYTQYLVFLPEQHFEDKAQKSRMYHDMHTGRWWWYTQEEIEKKSPGATIIPIILSSDKTQITNLGQKSAYPVYMTIGNLPKEIRRKPSWNAHVLLAYLPVAKLNHITNDESRRRMSNNLFHTCMKVITQPLIKPGEDGMPLQSGDGVYRKTHPIVAAYCADYMEQIVVAGCKNGECPIGDIKSQNIGDPNHDAQCEVKDLDIISEALSSFDEFPANFLAVCKEVGIKPIPSAFWKDLPYCNIFMSIAPDTLHQLYQGLLKHLIGWIKSAYSAEELDRRCSQLPPNHQVRSFITGITHLSRLTGREHNDIASFLLGLIIDLPLKKKRRYSTLKLVRATRAMLDFLYLAQYPVHTKETLKLLKEALHTFHANKEIFQQLGIQKKWGIPKLHVIMHYMALIGWLGTLDNFDTQYTERLHIDLAKDAYEATNQKDEFTQMTIWLERKEKIQRHDKYVKWCITGQPDKDLAKNSFSTPSNRIQMTKEPSEKSVPLEKIQQEHFAPFLKEALAIHIVQAQYPGLSSEEIENRAKIYHLPFTQLAIYYCAKFWLGDNNHPQLKTDEMDTVWARPAYKDKNGIQKPGQFDTALINKGNGEYIGLEGKNSHFRHVIFTNTDKYYRI